MLVLGATSCWRLSGILIRLVEEASSYHIILYRSLGLAAMLGGMIALVPVVRKLIPCQGARW